MLQENAIAMFSLDIHALKSKQDIENVILDIIKNSGDATTDTVDENSNLCCNETLKTSRENESVKIPVLTIGPLKINGHIYNIPIATRDESLVEHLNGIARVLFDKGVISETVQGNMSAVSVVQFKSTKQTGQALLWLNTPKNLKLMKNVFENSCPARILCRVHGNVAGPFLSIRFTLQHQQDESMEIRNVTKGAVAVLGLMKQIFDDMKIVSCTGDLRCSEDKSCVAEPSSSTQSRLMTMEGTGECVVAQALVSTQLIRKTLKCSLQDLIMAQKLKNLIDGSATTGLSPYTANILSSVYLALGKNPVGMILRSSCSTEIKSRSLDMDHSGKGMQISCTFPSFYYNSSDLKIPDEDTITTAKYKNIIDNLKDIISSVVLISELDQLRHLAVNFVDSTGPD